MLNAHRRNPQIMDSCDEVIIVLKNEAPQKCRETTSCGNLLASTAQSLMMHWQVDVLSNLPIPVQMLTAISPSDRQLLGVNWFEAESIPHVKLQLHEIVMGPFQTWERGSFFSIQKQIQRI